MENRSLIWVYPPNNWVSNYKRTFVYGSSNPKAKLFINNKKIKIFSNGNFAQKIKLPAKRNNIQLVQYLNGKRKIITRHIIVKDGVIKRFKRVTSLRGAKQRSNLTNVRRLLRQPFPPKVDPPLVGRLLHKDMVIVIDPGHGGKEHGTHSPKRIPESHFNLQIGKLLFKKLRSVCKKIYLTRTKDKFVSLKERVNFAKKERCNLLISIHHNALPDNEDPLKHRGIGIYYTHDFVKPLAKKLLSSISKESRLKKYGVFKRNLALTKPDFCYAVLVECGFLTHPIESEHITKKETQEQIVNGIMKVLIT